MGTITEQERQAVIRKSVIFGHYEEVVDRESAYERLKSKSAAAAPSPVEAKPAGRPSQRQGPVEAFIVSTVRSIGSQVGRQIMRGIMGSMMGGTRRR
jgi:hypothetical protein